MANKNRKDIVTEPSKNTIYDDSIFKVINPNRCDNLSCLNGEELQEIIYLLDEFYIQLRNRIGIDNYITFGMELELENARAELIKDELRRIFPNGEWMTKHDGTLHNGIEINSPILMDTLKDWQNLNKVCEISEFLASVDTHSGGHIHIGTQALGSKKESWLNFLKMWSVYENVIYRFAYGDFLTARPSMQQYAKPRADNFWRCYKLYKSENPTLEAIIIYLSSNRYQAVNFSNVVPESLDNCRKKNTIEFRCPNSSLNPAIWQNNVNLFVKMLCYCKSASFNDDLVEKRHDKYLDKYAGLEYYDEIFLDQAIELCDMIFTNNVDKIYFLKQYLKSFEVCENRQDYPKAHILTKKQINNN